MINTNVTNFRKQIFELIDQTVKYNEPINHQHQKRKCCSYK